MSSSVDGSSSSENPRHINNICQLMKLPTNIANAYLKLGVETLYEWQYDCIQKSGALLNENIVYCAPTSGGKTLISELIILRTAISYKKRAIFVLPFVTLVLEKAAYFKKIISGYVRSLRKDERFTIKSYHSDVSVNQIRPSDLIVLCTIEKANQLINTLIARGGSSGIGCVIVDEMHTLGDSFNGYLLEILISKLKYLEKKSREQLTKFKAAQSKQSVTQVMRSPESVDIQLGAMSATVGNIHALAAWFDSKLFVSDFRPMPLRESVLVGEDVLDVKGEVTRRLSLGPMPKSNTSHIELMNRTIMHLCAEGLMSGQQILVFCPTKQMCQQTSDMLLKQLVPRSRGLFTHTTVSWTPEQLVFRRQLSSQKLENSEEDLLLQGTMEKSPASSLSMQLQGLVQKGLGFHHSGLNSNQRVIIENAFRSGEISILAATSTLAAGVNLPAGRVIIRSLAIGKDDLTVTNYKQMTGRAGRAGQCINGYGESFLLATRSELHKALQLVNQPLPDVTSQMNPRLDGGRGLMKAILEMHSLDICQTLSDTLEYVKGTLLYKENSKEAASSSTPSSSSSSTLTVSNTVGGFTSEMLETILGCVNFLLLANALDMSSPPHIQAITTNLKPSSSSSVPSSSTATATAANAASGQGMKKTSSTMASVDPGEAPSTPCLTVQNMDSFRDRALIITRFGRAIVQSSLNPDEAIIVYKDLLRAQNGINLESNFHLIYLLCPVEHTFTPDFSRLLRWYDKGKQACKLRDPKDEFVGDSIGLEEGYGLLTNWTFNPPTRDAISSCVDKVRKLSLRTWTDRSAVQDKNYFETLVRCKRVWVALIADELLQGIKPIHQLAVELHVPPTDLEHLRRSVTMMASRVQRFCAEVGWSALERLIGSFKETVLCSDDINEGKELLQLEGVTLKLAETLAARGIKTASDLLVHPAEELAAFLQLQSGFTVASNNSTTRTTTTTTTSATITTTTSSDVNLNAEDTMMSIDSSVFESVSREEKVFRSLKALMEIVLESARKFVQKQKEEEEKKLLEVLSSASGDPSDNPPVATKETKTALGRYSRTSSTNTVEVELVQLRPAYEGSEVDAGDDSGVESDKAEDADEGDDDLEEEDELNDSSDSGYWSTEEALDKALARQELRREESSMTFTRVLQSPVKSSPRKVSTDRVRSPLPAPQLLPQPPLQVTEQSRARTHAQAQQQQQETQESQASVLSLLDQVLGRAGPPQRPSFQYDVPAVSSSSSAAAAVSSALDVKPVESITAKVFTEPVATGVSIRANTVAKTNEKAHVNEKSDSLPSWCLEESPHFAYDVGDYDYDEYEDESKDDYVPTPHAKIRRIETVAEAKENADSNLSTSEMLHGMKILSSRKPTNEARVDSEPNIDVPTAPHGPHLKRKVGVSLNADRSDDSKSKHSKVRSTSSQSSQGSSASTVDNTVAATKPAKTPMLRGPRTSTGSHARVTPSPYLTPFTASKFKDTPNHYLYLPQTQMISRNVHSAARESILSSANLSEKGIDPSSDVDPSSRLPVFSADICTATSSSQGFGYRHLSKAANCRIFLQKLLHSRCVSFELAFRRIPKASLPQRWKWASRISWFCSNDSSEDHGGVCSLTTLTPNAIRPNTGMRDPHVLTGIAFSFGDEYGYYLPLPCSLPVSFEKGPEQSTSEVSASTSGASGLQSLPLKCHRLICRFVGFESILNRCPYLRSRTRGHENSPSSATTLVRNPLLEVNRYWVRVARQTLAIEWRKGQCVEWRLLNEIMGNSQITKVAVDMQAKLVTLRERDVLVDGPLEDPLVAISLLINATAQGVISDQAKSTKQFGNSKPPDAPSTFPTSLVYPSHVHSEMMRAKTRAGAGTDATSSLAIDPTQSQACRLTCYRSVSILRNVATLTKFLSNHGVLEIFRNIEMPLLLTTADMEFHGMAVNSAFFATLKSDIEDRMQVIEHYFKCVEGPNFSVSSYRDLAKMSEKLLVSYRDILNQKLKAMRVFDFDESSEKYAFYLKCLEDAPERLQKHPLILLAKEFVFFQRAVLPFCTEVTGLRKFIGRIRADIQSIGTETGRLIITNPPLQNAPKKEFFCNAVDRPSMHEEVLTLARQQGIQVAELCEHINHSIDTGERIIDVRVHALNLRSDTGVNIGRVLKISDKFVSETADGVEDDVTNGAVDDAAVVDTWRQAGHEFTEDEATRIRQVVVRFPNNLTKLYAYPANKVYRIDAPITPNTDELEIINKALMEGIWNCNKTFSIGDSCCLLSESAIKAKRSATSDSDDPASLPLQNLRNGFVASEGYVLLSADYAQMELRLLAHFSEDANLCKAFKCQQDVFKVLAARWKNKDIDDITVTERNMIKQLCYANIYGSGAHAIAKQADVTVEEAKHMMQDFLESYPGISTFITSVKESCRATGYITTLLGRRRALPLINSENRQEQAKGGRQAVNSMCQGSAADLIKLAMVNISYRLSQLTSADMSSDATQQLGDEANSNNASSTLPVKRDVNCRRSRRFPGGGLYSALDSVRLVLQVHDELVFEVRRDLLPAVSCIVRECMEEAVELRVPLQVKLSSGPAWGRLTQLPTDYGKIRSSDTSLRDEAGARPPLARAIFGKEDD